MIFHLQKSKIKSMNNSQNEELQHLVEIQEHLIKKQQRELSSVSDISKKLIENNLLRDQIQKQIQDEMKRAVQDNQQIYDIKSQIQIIPDSSDSQITATDATNVLHYVEKIQDLIFSASEKCLRNPDSSMSSQELAFLIMGINSIIDKAVQSGTIQESSEACIERQRSIINSIISLSQTKDQMN